MQTTQNISPEHLRDIVHAIFDQGPVIVKQAYSGHDRNTVEFPDANALIEDLTHSEDRKPMFLHYAIYYPDAKGHVSERRIHLKPESCKGHTFRFCQEGWGLIFLQCEFRNYPSIKCNIAVNSETRAANWSDTYPELKDPSLWDWDVVKTKASPLIRLLRKYALRPDPPAAHP
jgi:hypothetical protein